MASTVIILMGSKSDLKHAQKIGAILDTFGVPYVYRICSAHKATTRCLEIINEYEQYEGSLIYITIAGRSNALSAVVDANTRFPTIACPPPSESFGGADVFSSLRLPSGIASATLLEPEGAALMAVKTFALHDNVLTEKLIAYKQRLVDELIKADAEVTQG